MGVANRDIVQDKQISASTYYSSRHMPHYGRLYGTRGLGWCVKANNMRDWLQVNLDKTLSVCGIATQGGSDKGIDQEWTKSYSISTSLDGITFTDYKEENAKKVTVIQYHKSHCRTITQRLMSRNS